MVLRQGESVELVEGFEPHSQGVPTATGQSKVRSKPSLDALTGLRFLAAMGVVFYHFSVPILKERSQVLANIVSSGFIAVDLFYLLSGFILTYTYVSRGGILLGNRRNFYAARFARIYPAYFLAFIIAAPADIATSFQANHWPVAVAKLSASAALVLTLQQAWTPWTAWSWNYPAWSVSVEVFFYIVFPWIGVSLSRLRAASAARWACALWILALSAPFALWMAKGTTAPPSLGDHLQMTIEFTPIFRLPEFMLGILLGRAYTLGQFSRLDGNWLASIAAVAIFGVLAFCPSMPHPLLANGLLAPLFAVLIVGLAQGRGPIAWFLSLPFMVALGEASYGIYIFQLPLALLIRKPPPYYSVRMLCFYCILLTLFSVLSWHFVEAPLRRNIRRWLNPNSGRP